MATLAQLQIVFAAYKAQGQLPLMCPVCTLTIDGPETADLRREPHGADVVVHKLCPTSRSRHGAGRAAWAGSSVKRVAAPTPPHTNCAAPHPHNVWNSNKEFCGINVHGLPDGKHAGAHGFYRGSGTDDRWNAAGEVWDSDPFMPVLASERGAHCDDAWGPSGLACCFNPRCKNCRSEEVRNVG